MSKLYQWYEMNEQLKKLKAEELSLRKEIFAEYFPEPVEGTNRCDVEGNAQLVANFPYNYTVDADNLEAGLKHVPKSQKDTLITMKPSMSTKVYRQLSNKARTGFTSECLTVTPGTPSLQIVPKADTE